MREHTSRPWTCAGAGLNRARYYPGDFANPKIVWRREFSPDVAHWEVTGADGRAFVCLKDGSLCALDLETGSTLWTRSGGGPTVEPVTVIDDAVLVARETVLQKLDAATGATLWEVGNERGRDVNLGSPLLDESDFAAGLLSRDDSGDLVVGSERGIIRHYSLQTGECLRHHDLRGAFLRGAGPYVFGLIGKPSERRSPLRVFDPNTGKLCKADWGRHDKGLSYVCDAGRAYKTTERFLSCIEVPSGKVAWRTEYAPDELGVLNLGGDEDSIYVQRGRTMGAYRRKDGSCYWEFSEGFRVFGSSQCVIGQSLIYVTALRAANIAAIEAYDKATGSMRWSAPVDPSEAVRWLFPVAIDESLLFEGLRSLTCLRST